MANNKFTFVFIPAKEEAPIELRTADKSGGLAEDALLKTAKEYFHMEGVDPFASASTEERQKMAAEFRQQIGSYNEQMKSQIDKMSDEDVLSLVRTTQQSTGSCEIVPITIPSVQNQFQAVSLYMGPQSLPSQLENTRAMQLFTAASGGTRKTIYGDAFVGRCYDNEEEDWVRLDFTLDDARPGAEWCCQQRIAATQKSKQPEDTPSDNYTWTQSDEDVEIKLQVPANTRAKQVVVQFAKKALTVKLQGRVILEGTTGGEVNTGDCTYTIQDDQHGRELCIVLAKRQPKFVWGRAVEPNGDTISPSHPNT